MALWGLDEYWATPAEALSINGADCEDFAIAKFFTLKELGVPNARLRLVYARQTHSPEAHMVLAYYSEPRADPLILDNLVGDITPASRRPDLTPVYTFNDDDLLFLKQSSSPVRVDTFSHRRWRELLAKLMREQTY
jgi:predicted transglutaminase-like cysteine proteinase